MKLIIDRQCQYHFEVLSNILINYVFRIFSLEVLNLFKKIFFDIPFTSHYIPLKSMQVAQFTDKTVIYDNK